MRDRWVPHPHPRTWCRKGRVLSERFHPHDQAGWGANPESRRCSTHGAIDPASGYAGENVPASGEGRVSSRSWVGSAGDRLHTIEVISVQQLHQLKQTVGRLFRLLDSQRG